MEIDDSEIIYGWFSEVCTKCKHLQDGYSRKCKAFDEIPIPIWEGKNNHTKPYKGDNGIQFEPIKE